MKTIYKYEIKAGLNIIDMPYGADILDVQVQCDKTQLWALVDTEHPNEARKFFPIGTGWPMDKALEQVNKFLKYDKYVGTFQLNEWGLVYHLFEVK